MTDRRTFLKLSALSAPALILGLKATGQAAENVYAGIIYTAERPGQWAGKASSHAPVISVQGPEIQVETKHPMSTGHYIVRHTLVLEDGTVVGSKTFTPTDTPRSSYTLPSGYTGRIYATSFCNLHDFWLSEIRISS